MSSEEDMSDLRYGQVLRKSLEVKDVRKHTVQQQPLFPLHMNSAAISAPFLLAAKPFNNDDNDNDNDNLT